MQLFNVRWRRYWTGNWSTLRCVRRARMMVPKFRCYSVSVHIFFNTSAHERLAPLVVAFLSTVPRETRYWWRDSASSSSSVFTQTLTLFLLSYAAVCPRFSASLYIFSCSGQVIYLSELRSISEGYSVLCVALCHEHIFSLWYRWCLSLQCHVLSQKVITWLFLLKFTIFAVYFCIRMSFYSFFLTYTFQSARCFFPCGDSIYLSQSSSYFG